jgi:aryl-alcohol dehydrogenase-like predicted oxidoreductase
VKFVDAGGGVRLSAIGLGTWQFGSGDWSYGKEYAETVAPAIVERSLDLGINLIDSAEAYGFGSSERILGRAIANRRDEVFLATKLFPILPVDPVVAWRARLSAARLGVSILDLYQVHWPNPVVPLGPTMRAMKKLQDEGLVRHVGVSNFSLARWQEAERELGGPVLTNQVQFNLLHRHPERELLAWAQENGRIVIAYSPLAQGLLSGRYRAGDVPAGIRGSTPGFLPENVERAQPVIEAVRQVAAAHGATSSQVALAWLVRRPGVVVIPGASSIAQVEQNIAAADLELTDDEDAALTAAADDYRPIGGRDAVIRITQVRAGRAANRVRRAVEGLRA